MAQSKLRAFFRRLFRRGREIRSTPDAGRDKLRDRDDFSDPSAQEGPLGSENEMRDGGDSTRFPPKDRNVA